MKQEDKAKAYDKVRKKIAIRFGSNVADEFFAEFEGSKDERVRKELIVFLEEFSKLGKNTNFDKWETSDCANWIVWLENVPYTIDHEKREGFHLGYKACLEKQGEQKSAEWSEEDEQHIDSLLKRLDALCRNKFERTRFAISEDREWLKSLKDMVQPKQEWSEEDEKIINGLIDSLTRISLNTRTDSTSPNYSFYREIDWLKSIRPQNTWKPSELQLGCLSDAIEHYNSFGYPAPKLKELLDDLKKLKGEV